MTEPDHDRLREIRRALLRNRYARAGCGQRASAIHASLRLDIPDVTQDEVEAALSYLAKTDPPLVASTRDALAAGVEYWDITRAGIDLYEGGQ